MAEVADSYLTTQTPLAVRLDCSDHAPEKARPFAPPSRLRRLGKDGSMKLLMGWKKYFHFLPWGHLTIGAGLFYALALLPILTPYAHNVELLAPMPKFLFVTFSLAMGTTLWRHSCQVAAVRERLDSAIDLCYAAMRIVGDGGVSNRRAALLRVQLADGLLKLFGKDWWCYPYRELCELYAQRKRPRPQRMSA